MRNWHQRIIRLDEAIQLLGNSGNENIYVGVLEGAIEYSLLPMANNNDIINVDDYRAAHPIFGHTNANKKVFFRRINTGSVINVDKYTESITKSQKPDFHSVSVTGIIAGNDLENNLKGISSNIRIINSLNYYDLFIVARINHISIKNLKSIYYKKYSSNVFLNNLVNIDNKFFYNRLIPKNDYDLTHDNEYSSKSVSFINHSAHPSKGSFNDSTVLTKINSDEVNFMQQELFAYGRNGRGVLSIFSAGNGNSNGLGFEIDDINRFNTKSSKSLIVAASRVSFEENDYDIINGYKDNPSTIKEEYATYSNYGVRIDLCAPSSPRAIPRNDEVSIYAPTIVNGGEIGSDENQILIKRVLKVENNSKLELDNVLGLFKGQTIELGDVDDFTFFNEIRVIDDIKTESNSTGTKYYAILNKDIIYTKKFSGKANAIIDNTDARITVLKIPVERIVNNNSFVIQNRRGIKRPPLGSNKTAERQWVFIYDANDIQKNVRTQIMNVITNKNGLVETFTIEVTNPLPNAANLILIPDQIATEVKSDGSIDDETGTNSFTCTNSNDLDGFFEGQQVAINGQTGHISYVNYDDKTFRISHIYLSAGKTYTIKSLGYGDYTNSFGGTSSAAPIVTGVAALILSANSNLNASEIKHILKSSTDQIGNVDYNDSPTVDVNKYNYGYLINKRYGTGRVNAHKAIQMASNWNAEMKPRLEIFDDPNNALNSLDIIINGNQASNNLNLNSNTDTIIKVNIHNTGNRNSFIESDIRLLMAFIPEENEGVYNQDQFKFPFPDYWYENPTKEFTDLKRISLLGVKEIGLISPGASKQIDFSIKNADLKKMYNSNSWRKSRVFLLAHIAPFDGEEAALSRVDYRANKQLTCKEISVTQTVMQQGNTSLFDNKLDMTVGDEIVAKNFNLTMENVLDTDLNALRIQATKKNKNNQTTETVIYKKTGSVWALESGAPEWIQFETPNETASLYNDYKIMNFPHTLKINEQIEQVKLEIIA